jgi:hypothetical protein
VVDFAIPDFTISNSIFPLDTVSAFFHHQSLSVMREKYAVNSKLPPTPPSGDLSSEDVEYLARCFNTAIISTRAETLSVKPEDLNQVLNSAAFRHILGAVRKLAREMSVSDAAAAESIIQTFRKTDLIWSEYVFREGLARLKEQSSGL